jgi:hypothetical protein
VSVHARLIEQLAPARVEAMSDAELMLLVAQIWADLPARELLHGSRGFFLERLQFYGHRGYLTARERQGIINNFFAPAVDYPRKLQGLVK